MSRNMPIFYLRSFSQKNCEAKFMLFLHPRKKPERLHLAVDKCSYGVYTEKNFCNTLFFHVACEIQIRKGYIQKNSTVIPYFGVWKGYGREFFLYIPFKSRLGLFLKDISGFFSFFKGFSDYFFPIYPFLCEIYHSFPLFSHGIQICG